MWRNAANLIAATVAVLLAATVAQAAQITYAHASVTSPEHVHDGIWVDTDGDLGLFACESEARADCGACETYSWVRSYARRLDDIEPPRFGLYGAGIAGNVYELSRIATAGETVDMFGRASPWNGGVRLSGPGAVANCLLYHPRNPILRVPAVPGTMQTAFVRLEVDGVPVVSDSVSLDGEGNIVYDSSPDWWIDSFFDVVQEFDADAGEDVYRLIPGTAWDASFPVTLPTDADLHLLFDLGGRTQLGGDIEFPGDMWNLWLPITLLIPEGFSISFLGGIPEPGTAWLLGVAGLALLARRRR